MPLSVVKAAVASAKKEIQKRADPTVQPEVRKKHAETAVWKKMEGQLYVDGISADDPVQGFTGDCYAISGFASLAQANPKAIQDAIKDNGNGTYTVRFYKQSFLGVVGRGQKRSYVTVDASAPTKDGKPLYAKARNPKELWPLILEKAWAKFDGSYTSAQSGAPTTVWQALTGKAGSFTINNTRFDGLFNQMKRALKEHRPVAATTTLSLTKKGTEKNGIVKKHVYSVLGVSERNGQKYVTLRNPWGDTEPGKDGKNDGIFELKFETFKKQYGMTFFGA